MNEATIEYRKASAEALGKPTVPIGNGELVIHEDGTSIVWHPDIRADQQNMIEDLLIKQGKSLRFVFNQQVVLIERKWYCNIDTEDEIWSGNDNSKSIAFMKAFMEYIKTK